MFFDRKYKLLDTDFFKRFVDYHSHILPAVDDGVSCVDDAIAILKQYEEMGVKKVVFTPHIADSFPQNSASFLRSEFEKFKSLYSGDIELHLAAEYMLDSNFYTHFQSGDLLTLWDNYLLIETSYIEAPINFTQTLQKIQSEGYFVVLAHPERYTYMDRGLYAELVDMNILLQLDLLSLSGYYGGESKKRAEYLLAKNMYKIVGTDIHSLKQCEIDLKNTKLKEKIIKKLNR